MEHGQRSKMCHGSSSRNVSRSRICEPREMRLSLRTPRLEGIDPDTPSSRRFSLYRVAVAASRTLRYSRWNEGAKPRLLDKPLHRPSTINAISFIHSWKKIQSVLYTRVLKPYFLLYFMRVIKLRIIEIKLSHIIVAFFPLALTYNYLSSYLNIRIISALKFVFN